MARHNDDRRPAGPQPGSVTVQMGLLDTLIVLSAACAFALLALSLMAKIADRPLDLAPPGYVVSAAKDIWQWVAAGAGSSLLLAALRRGMDKDSPAPNYLANIVVVSILLVAIVLAGLRLIPEPQPVPRATGSTAPVAPPEASTSVPSSFTVDYPFSDPHGSGIRVWRKVDGIWIERFPDGVEARSPFTGRIVVDGDEGTLTRRTGSDVTYEYFIPDKGSKLMWLRIRQPEGSWSFVNEMKDVT